MSIITKVPYLYVVFIGSWVCLPGLVWADEDAAPSYFSVTGYIDGSYNYLENDHQFTSGVNDRVFDLDENGLTLQQAAVTMAYQPPEGFGGLMNVLVGRDAYTTASYGLDPDIFGVSHEIGFDFPQAYGQYTLGPITVIAGRYTAIAGVEVIDPTQNVNFSRSIIFGYVTPDTLTGARTTYTVSPALTLIAGVNNGWDNVRDISRRKTLELGAAYIFNPMFSLAVAGYSGEQRATDFVDEGPTGTRNLIDVIGTMNVTDNLSFELNYDYGMQNTAALPDGSLDNATWQAVAGYVTYKCAAQWHVSLRGEYFDDKDGYRTGIEQQWKEVTFTVGYVPIKNVEVRAETRHDFSNADAWMEKDNVDKPKNYQQSYAVEVFYKF